MITNISYNVLIERFRAFAEGHYLIKGFTHGDPSNVNLEKGVEFPWMHVFPVEVAPQSGSRLYSFIITFADLPRDKETPPEYQREMLSDCIRLAEDLLAEIQNGLTLFGPTVELDGAASIECFINEFSHTLTGVNLSLTLSVPWDWSACDIPADWSVGGSGSGGTGAGQGGIVLETNGELNGDQTLLNLQQGANVTIVDNGSGTITISATGGTGAVDWGDIGGTLADQTDLQTALDAKANSADLGPTAFSNDYNDLDNLPTIPPAQVNSDWNSVSGVSEILNKPTIPAAQVNSDWNASSGVAEILNKPTIPTTLDSLSDVTAPSPTNGQVLTWNGSAWVNSTPTTSGGTVTSVGLTMPSAFAVTGSPVTTAGTLAVTGAGTTSQYVRGDGTLANFPSTGGGGGQIFYFNGNISQGTIGGNAFYQLGTAANTGPAANFTRATTGVIASFITDVGAPNHLIIPSGVWTVDVYLSETGGGSNHAQINAKLYVYNGSTFTLIATSPTEEITNGNVPDLYTFTISVPNTATTATDRIAIEFDIANTNGKTVTLYTEDGKIGEVHTTYAIGLSSLNGLTANTQTFATGTAGTDFGINSAGSVHTFNLPTASASNRGALSSADWSTFNGKQAALVSGTSIKTINSTSLLGSGDVAVQPTLVSGTNIKTINSISILGSGNIPLATTDSTIFSANPNNTQGANSTAFWALSGSLGPSATENFRNIVMPVAGTLRNLYIRNGSAQSGTGSMTFTLRKNGVDTAMTVTYANADGAATTKSDTTNTVSVVAGDLICIKAVNAAPSSASGNFVSFTILLER